MASTGVQKIRYARPACPFCRRDLSVVRIVYGNPTPELVNQARSGEIALGGGSIPPDAHPWYCRDCLRSFAAPGFKENV